MMPVFPSEAFLRRWAIRIALVWLAVLYGRTAWVSRDEHASAVIAARAGDVHSAIAHHRRALRHAAPPLDAADESLAALEAIAANARSSRATELELEALRAIRGSLVASRWSFSRRGDVLARTDRALAQAVARLDRSPSFRELSADEVASMHLRELASVPAERPYGVFLAVVGFFAFVYFSHRLLTQDVTVDDTWNPVAARATLRWLGLSFLAFVVGLVVT